jgi:hypothetical protein
LLIAVALLLAPRGASSKKGHAMARIFSACVPLSLAVNRYHASHAGAVQRKKKEETMTELRNWISSKTLAKARTTNGILERVK